ncbi:hypothetical protein ACFYVD_08005 [Rhodococcus pyridinivorans]|uniref:hypothetical protein n=1 Tax=Rhodococcus pyridinivorans TaxID=103816 RepID=UPI0036B28858
MSAAQSTIDQIVELDAEASADLFDRIARRNMQISGDEFLARWDAGDFEDMDWDEIPGLVDVAMALPLARR